MIVYRLKIFAWLVFGLMLSVVPVNAIEMADDVAIDTADPDQHTRYLNGYFISLQGNQLRTDLGEYILTNMAKVIDSRSPGSSAKSKVQLTLRNNILIRVVIY